MGPINFDVKGFIVTIIIAGMLLGVAAWEILSWLFSHISFAWK